MKLLLDSGVWWWQYHRLPLAPGLRALLATPGAALYLCPLSVTEMLYKWRHKPKRLPGPPPAQWLAHSLTGFHLAPFTWEAAELAGLWEWPHGDPIDRALAAVAQVQNLTLVHTDTVLRGLAGFPQKYFPKVEV